MTHSNSLFAPYHLGQLALSNRIVMAPMTRNRSPGNIPGADVARYYRRRAQGGVGLIITEGTHINHPSASAYVDVPFFYGEQALAGWQQVVDEVHAVGGKIAPQLWHVGALRGLGLPGTSLEPYPDIPAFTPSGLLKPGRPNGYSMSQKDIDKVVAAFAQGAADAQRLGFDAIELHGAHGYLIDQFFWEGTNQRSDHYGGSIEKRTQFAVDIVSAVRARIGPDMPIILRFSQWKLVDYDARLVQSPQELERFLAPLVNAGVDAFHCSTRRFWEPEFADSDLNLAGWTKQLTGKPTITVGSVSLDQDFIDERERGISTHAEPASLRNLSSLLERGDFDLVAVGRSLISNPDWALLIKDGREGDLLAYDKANLENLI